ncbi:Vinorine synthase [Quillaja saponaria]|uniref:Vinorine synthase n=1 Tax=Quillaja saponaria TaxID=32244 RepID=A0AAD7LU56_QUISA|nr:Vinorine synthase [Quillaja saponaria]
MEINIISRETIKPSSQTPHHLKTLKLSLFDQLAPRTYNPLVLFYSVSTNDPLELLNKINQLKNSLSETLTSFYPLAGRENDDQISLDCNDEGALYLEARVNHDMLEFLKPAPKLELLNKLLPCQPYTIIPNPTLVPQVAIQVNFFKCGGIAIGMCFLHTLLDGISMFAFLSSWSATSCKSSNENPSPEFATASTLFPPQDVSDTNIRSYVAKMFKENEQIPTRRFVFDAQAIESLKAMAKCESIPNPSRYEVLTTFIWKCVIASFWTAPHGEMRPSMTAHMVDMRRRIKEPLSKYSVGNIVFTAHGVYEGNERKIDIKELIGIVRQLVSEVDSDFLTSLQGESGFLGMEEILKLLNEVMEQEKPFLFWFTSWCNLGLYELDFGWGKPIWVGFKGGNGRSLVDQAVLIDTIKG